MVPFEIPALLIATSLTSAGLYAVARRRRDRSGHRAVHAHGRPTAAAAPEVATLRSNLLDALHDAVYSLSPDLRILTWNAAAERIYGFPAAEVLGRKAPELLGAEFAGGEPVEAVLDELDRVGHARRELIQVRRDGKRISLEAHAVVVRDGSGAITGYVMANRDVTERNRAEEALRASEAKFRAAFHGAGIAICLLDRDGRLREYNRAFREMLGYSDAELQERTIASLLHPDDVARMRVDFREAIDGRKDLVTGERRYRHRSGSWVHVFLRSSIVRDDAGNFLYSVGLMEDVTQKKAMEAQLVFADRMASMGTLAAGVAHEINNPLSFILANIDYLSEELARDEPPRDELLRALEETREGAVRVREIVRDLKTFSRADEHRDEALDIRQVLQSSISLTQNEIRHRARLVLDLHEVPPVSASAHRLGQVFVNLLINAAQAITDANVERNEIRVACGIGPDGRISVEVSDTGRGIAPENMPRIFEPFFTTKPVGVGTGLGLSICHGIVTQLDGEIQVDSQLGRGSTFRVLLPRAGGDAAEVSARRRAGGATERGARILVVDDEPMIGKAVARTLSPGHEVTAVSSARGALARLDLDGGYDILICDLMMPEMTGMELFGKLVEDRPALADRTVFLTGGAFTPQALEFLDRVGNPRLEKPFDADALRAVVKQLLSRERPSSASR